MASQAQQGCSEQIAFTAPGPFVLDVMGRYLDWSICPVAASLHSRTKQDDVRAPSPHGRLSAQRSADAPAESLKHRWTCEHLLNKLTSSSSSSLLLLLLLLLLLDFDHPFGLTFKSPAPSNHSHLVVVNQLKPEPAKFHYHAVAPNLDLCQRGRPRQQEPEDVKRGPPGAVPRSSHETERRWQASSPRTRRYLIGCHSARAASKSPESPRHPLRIEVPFFLLPSFLSPAVIPPTYLVLVHCGPNEPLASSLQLTNTPALLLFLPEHAIDGPRQTISWAASFPLI
ncbi:unnamed protein product [Pleuronectes platessa]|uniref:Uncharacterized protein n=1 Tax=Pleuronectes platessa TaxID=8262 RepID=A0A9N7W1Z5_PLEPL|nr:unnamed protein product [Pleuronectes platessa]